MDTGQDGCRPAPGGGPSEEDRQNQGQEGGTGRGAHVGPGTPGRCTAQGPRAAPAQ